MKKILFQLFMLIFVVVFHPTLKAQSFDNKDFYVKSILSGKYLDVYGWSEDDGGQIVQWDFHGGANQIFRFKSAGDGFYYIQSLHSNKFLHVDNDSMEDEVNIIQKGFSDDPSSKFLILKTEDGGFYLQAQHSGKYLEILSDTLQNGDPLKQNKSTKTNAQKFAFEPRLLPTARNLHNKGFYIRARHSNKYMDVYGWSKSNGGEIVQWDFHGGINQMFLFESAEDGYYYIRSLHSNKYLMVSYGSQERIEQWPNFKFTRQQFRVMESGDGYYLFQARHSGKFVDVSLGSHDNGAQLRQFSLNRSEAQQFSLEFLFPPQTKQNLDYKVFFIKAKHSNKYLDVYGWSKSDGGQIVQWDFHGGINQMFLFKSAGNGYYYIQSLHSYKYLQVDDNASQDGAKITQRSFSNKPNFQFKVFETGTGYYYIQPRNGGNKYLEINAASNLNGAQLSQKNANRRDAQQFSLIQTKFDSFASINNIGPEENGFIVYQEVAPVSVISNRTGQLSVSFNITNNDSEDLELNYANFLYNEGGKWIRKRIHIGRFILPGKSIIWQNGRNYHEIGNVIIFEQHPFPSEVTVLFEFQDKLQIQQKLKLNTYQHPSTNGRYSLPFKSKHLNDGEFYFSASLHGGGPQVFALDMGVERIVQNSPFSFLNPSTSNLVKKRPAGAIKNHHHLVYCKPIYSVSNGEVVHFFNHIPENPDPPNVIDLKKYDVSGYSGGNGNAFFIRNGDEEIVYAHMIPGSLNPRLLSKGAKVKKGDFLGLVGNSGNSSAPHLHIHVNKIVNGRVVHRPINFEGAKVIDKNALLKLYNHLQLNNLPWVNLYGTTIPAQPSYILPYPETKIDAPLGAKGCVIKP